MSKLTIKEIRQNSSNNSKINELDLMGILNINTVGYDNIDKLEMITNAMFKEKGLVVQYKKGGKRAGINIRKVLQLIRTISKDIRADISVQNKKKTIERKLKKNKKIKDDN